jgi:hypothetical protein
VLDVGSADLVAALVRERGERNELVKLPRFASDLLVAGGFVPHVTVCVLASGDALELLRPCANS